jgi:hypothetical protein
MTTGKLIHHHQHPMAFEANRLTSEQIDTPKAVFHVAKVSEPGRATSAGVWAIVFDQDAPNDIPVNLDAERLRDDHCNAGTAEARIPAFNFNDGVNKWLGWALRPRFPAFL